MTRLGELLAPASRAALESLAADMMPRQSGNRGTRTYAAPRGGASTADMISELHLRAALYRVPIGGDVRYAWQRCRDYGGTFYRCRVTWWGRYDVNASRVVLADSLPALWDALADRELLPRDVWAESDAFLAFLMVGNVGPRRDTTQRVALAELATGTRETWKRYAPRRYRAADGTDWQLVTRYRGGTITRGLEPRDPKYGDA